MPVAVRLLWWFQTIVDLEFSVWLSKTPCRRKVLVGLNILLQSTVLGAETVTSQENDYPQRCSNGPIKSPPNDIPCCGATAWPIWIGIGDLISHWSDYAMKRKRKSGSHQTNLLLLLLLLLHLSGY